MNPDTLLFIAVESPFSERDWKRFDIEGLAERFNVRVIDLSPIAQPTLYRLRSETSIKETRVTAIMSIEQLESVFETVDGGALISNIGIGETRHHLFRLARSRNLLITEFELGAMPNIKERERSTLSRVIQRFRQVPSIWHVPKKVLGKIRRKSFSTDLPDVFYRGGQLARGRHPALGSEIVDVHSFDFELARTIDTTGLSIDPSRIAYLDQNIGFHSDVPGLGLKQPASAQDFYPLINEYFDWLESEHGFQIVICPHPRAEVSSTRERFPGREISQSPTALEVARSVSVLGHVSTSFSFAVIFRKPVTILTTSELSRSWYAPYISSFVDELAAPAVDLSTRSSWTKPLSAITETQRSLYALYEVNYLNSSFNQTRKLWELIGDDILSRI
jgi:hypothetical protein